MNAALAMPLEDAEFEHRVIENARSNWTSVTLVRGDHRKVHLRGQPCCPLCIVLSRSSASHTWPRPAHLPQPPAEDFRAALVEQLVASGLSREAVIAGIVVVGPMAAGDSERVSAAAHGFESLCSMGFPQDAVLGALCKHAGDVSAATEACLGCAEGD